MKKVGRKPKYGEPTKTIAFRIPKSHEPKIKELVAEYLLKLTRI